MIQSVTADHAGPEDYDVTHHVLLHAGSFFEDLFVVCQVSVFKISSIKSCGLDLVNWLVNSGDPAVIGIVGGL